MKKSPKAFETSKPRIIIIIIIISGFYLLFLGGGNDFISFDWLCFQTRRERKNLKRVNELNNAKYQYYHLILKLTK